jgi:hypothetical protein
VGGGTARKIRAGAEGSAWKMPVSIQHFAQCGSRGPGLDRTYAGAPSGPQIMRRQPLLPR